MLYNLYNIKIILKEFIISKKIKEGEIA